MDVNFSSKKIQYISNEPDKLPEAKQEDTSLQTNQRSTPEITPDSAILRAYAGIIEPKSTSYRTQININNILRKLKNKDGSYNTEAINLFLKHNKEFAPILTRRPDLVFNAIKNKDNEFCPKAIKYLNDNLRDNPNTATLINDLLTGKDENGNFSINILELNNYLHKEFGRYQVSTVKNVLSAFNQEQSKEREDFLEFAKSIREDYDFDKIITFIQENKSDDDSNSGLNFNKESAEFVKKLISTTISSPKLASIVYKNLNIPPQEYTDELLKDLGNICVVANKDTEICCIHKQ